jgi:hypothetical protein
MKIISFSVWGTDPTYTIGAIKNAKLAKELFPDWKCIFYCFNSVPTNIVDELKTMDNTIIRFENTFGDTRGAFNRFIPAEEEDVEYYICRDTDSRLSPREKIAVDSWINSGEDFHIMRDHPYHSTHMMAGMWGVKGGILKKMNNSIQNFNPKIEKGEDQNFLSKVVYPLIYNKQFTCKVHDPFFENKPFPSECKRGKENNGVWFIGQVFDEHDVYNSQSDVDQLMKRII